MRNYPFLLVVVLLAIIMVGCSKVIDTTFNGESAYRFAEKQLSFGPRIPGSKGNRSAGDWILSQLTDHGWRVETQEFEYQGVPIRNLIGKSSLNIENPPIILGAHYDTRPIADRNPTNQDQPIQGANDGASGVAVLLELSRVLDPSKLEPSVWIVFFDAEDSGGTEGWEWIVGSTYFAKHLEFNPDMVVIVDMVGDTDLQLYYERNSDPELSEQIWETASGLGYSAFVPERKFSLIDDHTAFLRLGYPAIDIIDFKYPYWHTTQDTLDKISPESLETVGRTLQTWLSSLTN
jgi:hypothetical protein